MVGCCLTSRTTTPSGEEVVRRGVVNGIYKYDPKHTRDMIVKYEAFVPAGDIDDLSARYVIHVGFKQNSTLASITSILPISYSDAQFANYVLLPAGWSADALAISNQRNVINVGDVVDVSIQAGRYYDSLKSLVRKCSEPPTEGERREWEIGCHTYKGFDDQDYAGEKYYFRRF